MIHKVERLILLCIIACQTLSLHSQAPEIQWQNTIGGIFTDNLSSINQTLDGGYILGGRSDSGISGDKTDEGNGGMDYWVIKLDSLGNIQWQNSIGGNDADYLYSAEQTSDGGFILGGVSFSGISGNKSEPNLGFPGSTDYWIVKITSTGIIEWENTIGGNKQDKLTFIKETSEGGYLVGGYSNSPTSGDKDEENWFGGDMEYDFWILKLDSLGNIDWQNDIGGFGDDLLNSGYEVTGHNYIIGGYSNSPLSGDKTEANIGYNDYWVLKLDSLGNILWQNTIGGISDDYLFSLQQTYDSGYIIGGYSNSPLSGDKTEASIGGTDYWILKLDSGGSIVWQNTIGGISDDYLFSVKQTSDLGYILGGYSNSNISIDKSENVIGGLDFWIIKISDLGMLEWENTIGGDDHDYLLDAKQVTIGPTADFGFILGGSSQSSDSGDKTEPNAGLPGFADYWVIKLSPQDCIPLEYFQDSDGDGYGNADMSTTSCIIPIGFTIDSSDCNDLIFEINPAAIEICNELDDNCNYNIDEDLSIYTYFIDVDEDGFGDGMTFINSCEGFPPYGFVNDSTDCDDTEDLIHEPILYFADNDFDLYGDELNSELYCTIFPPSGFTINSLDCNDSEIFVNPGSNEICNLIDDNCNNEVDEELPTSTFFYDSDNDNYGNVLIDSISCSASLTGYVLDSTDCDDSNQFVYPGAFESTNGIDDNCNELIDEVFLGNEDQIVEKSFKTFPNPNNGKFKIDFHSLSSQFIKIDIVDMYGQIIYTSNSKMESMSEINISNGFSGVVMVIIYTEKSIFQERIVVIN